jgi:outer membrane protein insertion porin family
MRRWYVLLILGLTLFFQDVAAMDKARLRWAQARPVIDSIAIVGNERISDSEIRRRLYSRTRSVWLAIKGDRRSKVQRETLGRDTLEVKYLYLTNGFLGVRVQHTVEPVGEDSAAVVRLNIEEGRQFRCGQAAVVGSFDSGLAARLQSLTWSLKPGTPVDPLRLSTVETEMKAVLANGGYPYATVQRSIDTTGSPDSCDITFAIVSDSLVHFGEVIIDGANSYPEYVARRELKITPGQVYRRDDILESQRRLFESGYYTTFQLRQADTSSDRLRPDFLLHLRERKTRQFTLKAGAGQSEYRDLVWNTSAAYGKRNFLGSRNLDGLADYSFSLGSDSRLITHRYRLRYTEPWFIGIRMPVAFTAEVRPRIHDVEQSFDKSSWSLAATVTKYFQRRAVKATLGAEYQSVKISGISQDSIEIVRQLQGISVRRKLYGTIRRDSRDDIFIPRRGSVTELSADYFGGFLGGDDSFFKIQASWSRYRIVWPGWISATRLRVGVADAFGKTVAVPLDEAIYVGGANTVRGFEENKLGPLRDDGTPLGTRYNVVFNQEFRWKTVQVLRVLPLVGRLFETFPLWQSLFVDVGNGFADRREIRFDNLAVTYGTGFQIVSPAGPIRVDYARVVPSDNFQFAQRWHFTILYAF